MTARRPRSVVRRLAAAILLALLLLFGVLAGSQVFHGALLAGLEEAYQLDRASARLSSVAHTAGAALATLREAPEAEERDQLRSVFSARHGKAVSELKALLGGGDWKLDGEASRLGAEALERLEQLGSGASSYFDRPDVAGGRFLVLSQQTLESVEALDRARVAVASRTAEVYRSLHERRREPFFLGLVLTLAFVALLGGTGFALVGQVRRFVNGLSGAAARVAAGDLSARAPVLSGDELGLLTESFNAMVAKLEAADRDLRRSNADLERFAHAVSHDLQTPLRHVSKFARMIVDSRGVGDAGEIGEWCAVVEDGVGRMQDLIRDLLGFSTLGAGDLEMGDVDLGIEARSVMAELSAPGAGGPSPELILEEMPVAKGNRSLVRALFQNLFSNAIKFSRKGSVPRIRVRGEDRGDAWLVSVEDEGIGVPEPYREKIFEAFRRLHTREEYPGSGIGLTICRRVVEHHGGRIWMEPAPRGGSRFVFTLAKDPPGAGGQ